MSNKFTGITSAGEFIPVWDKAAHSALNDKLDKSASGNFYPMESNPSGYLTEVPASAISGKADKSELSNYQPASAMTGYAPAGDYATKTEVQSATSGKLDASTFNSYSAAHSADDNTAYSAGANIGIENHVISVTGQLGKVYSGQNGVTVDNTNDKIGLDASAVSALEAFKGEYDLSAGTNVTFRTEGQTVYIDAAGEPLPEGLMDTSALGYDGNGNISGYNGSAFAQPNLDTYLQNTDLTIVDNKVTEISGVELSAGTELEFEYDSADNISAINNSAISTTPSQALYAKSPLYAGVSGTSSFIGVDETLLAQLIQQATSAAYNETKLWTTTATAGENIQTFNLSEPYTGFERIKIFYHINDGDAGCAEGMTTNTCLDAMTMANYAPNGTGTDIAKGLRYYLVNDNQISAADTCMFKSMGSTAVSHESYTVFYVQQIVGVNRKA